MDISRLIHHESVISPGVRYTVRRLGMVARSRRDSKMLNALSKQADLRALGESLTELDLRALCESPAPPDGTGESKRIVRAGKESEFERASLELSNLQYSEIIPAYLRAGLVKVEGYTADGEPMDAETFIEEADRDMLIEAQVYCAQASDLTDAERKNLQSRTTSPGLGQADAMNTTVPNAATSDTIEAVSA